jgi:ABC-type transport system involved in cytochrome bd biosynthesis fused ATPase/permease subunit
MEILLLLVDELDDAIGALRHIAPKIIGVLVACALVIGTGFALMQVPHAPLAVIALTLSATLIEAARRHRARALGHREL